MAPCFLRAERFLEEMSNGQQLNLQQQMTLQRLNFQQLHFQQQLNLQQLSYQQLHFQQHLQGITIALPAGGCHLQRLLRVV